MYIILIPHYLLTVLSSKFLRLICRCLALSRMSEASPMPDVTYMKMDGEIFLNAKCIVNRMMQSLFMLRETFCD